uniref:Alpha-L-fucosidase n=1 Tax=Rhabditophanes sp. KR3021 TaxID=114890 RepID=A0AC35TVK0_9BILA
MTDQLFVRYHWKSENPDPVVVAYMEKNYPKDLTYFDFAKDFKAMDFNASNIAEIVQATGARYFVFTSKHHEGFTMFPSKTTFGWNSVDVGPKRDIVMELKVAIEETKGVKFGLYFSLMAWFHQLFLNDVAMNRTDYVEQQSYPQLLELTNKYKPQIIWSDGDWDRSDTYWKSKEFLAWLFNDSPVSKEVVVNDRWGSGCMGKHGGFLTFADNYDPGVLILRKWENCDTIDKYSWASTCLCLT